MAIALLVLGCAGLLAGFVYASKSPQVFVYGGFALSGVLITPDLPIIGTRLALPDAALFLALIGFGSKVLLTGRIPTVRCHTSHLVLILGSLFLSWCILAFAVNAPRLDDPGLATSALEAFNYAYGFVIFALLVFSIRDWETWRRCLVAWGFGILVVALVSASAVLGLGPSWAFEGARVKSTLRAVNQLVSYVGPMLPLVLWVAADPAYRPRVRLASGVLAALAVLAMAVTGSRTAFILVALALLAVFAFAVPRMFQRRGNPFVAWAGIAVVFALVVYSVLTVTARGSLPENLAAVARPIQRSLLGGPGAAPDPRAAQFSLVVRTWWQYPVVGVGPANFKDTFNNRYEVHNSFLGVLIEQGLPALLFLVLFLATILWGALSGSRMLRTARDRPLVILVAIALLLLCVYGMTGFGIRQRIFWLVAGLTASAIELTHRTMGSQVFARDSVAFLRKAKMAKLTADAM